jgi:sn-glycerol 3-phosphate transport system substrate-binding protein
MSARRRAAALLAGCALLAACKSGDSLQQAGNDDSPRTTATSAASSSQPPSTAATDDTSAPSTAAPATTTTTPLASLPPCPVDALDDVTSPVEITFWHGMSASNETALAQLTDEYNASQQKVRVRLQNQGGYKQTIDKYVQSGQGSRPHLVMLPEYMVQQMADSDSVIPIGACLEASGYDTSAFLDRALLTYQTEGVQWSMPFNVSAPVLFFNTTAFEEAGLDPADPPVTIDELRAAAQAIVDGPGNRIGIAFDSGVDSGGGWFIEQWFARAGVPYADNDNGRSAPATKVLYDGELGVELLSEVQSLILDGLAVTVGDNANGQDALLKLADPQQPAVMTIATSAAIGTVKDVLDGGLIPGITSEQLGIGPMPGPGVVPSAIVGGASLYVVGDKGDAQAAAAWDYIQFLISAESQSTWAAATGYVPVREDALELDPIRTTYATDARYKVAYDQLVAGATGATSLGPVIGPMLEVRTVTAGAVAGIFGGADVAASLSDAAARANSLIAAYNARN